MALKKPSDFFGKKSEENNLPVVESDNTFREELDKVESLSEQINKLQQELTQKVVKSDLENLVISQINEMRDSFAYLQSEIKKSNQSDIKKFKETLSDIIKVVNNFVENELPKYKKQILSNELRVSNEIVEFKETVSDNYLGLKQEVEEQIENFYNTLNEYNDTIQVVDNTVSDTVLNVEKYIRENHKELVILKEEVFSEIKKIPVGNFQENLKRLEKKIDYIRETYSRMEPEVVAREIIQEGLLNEPPETKNDDPLTPLNQNFVTLEQLQEHYRLFINRIQQQISTLGGGGEVRLEFLDDIDRDSAKVNGRFLKYDAASDKWVGALGGGSGSQTLDETLKLGNNSLLGINVGVITATYFVGDGSLLTNVPGSVNSGYANTAGISTVAQGLTGSPNITVSSVNSSGIITALSFSGNASSATYASSSGISTYSQTSGIATSAGTATTATYLSDAANILTGTINKDRISTTNALTVLGDLYVSNNISFGGTTTQLNTQQLQIVDADIVLGIGTTFNSNDTTANHGGIAIASTEGTPLVDLNIVPGETNPYTYKKIMWFKGSTIGAGLTDAWLFNYGVGIGSTQVPNGVRLAVGNVKITENDLSVVRNINASGVVTAISYSGSGTNLTGIVTSITAGSGISVNQSTGNVTITATGGGGGSQTLDQTLGLGNTSSLGMSVGFVTATNINVTGIATIATGIVTTLRGTNINYTGVSTFTSTFLTNLNVSGVATVSTGIITTLRGTTLNYTGVSTFSNGPVLIGTATSTGTDLQRLQVTGGAYVSGSVGLGTTNPREKLDVVGGNIGIQGVGSTSRFYIQHNTAQNSLDFVFI